MAQEDLEMMDFLKNYMVQIKKIEKNLVELEWIDGKKLLFNQKQNASTQLKKVMNSFKNKIPKEVVDIFERYGFIWGGRWYHYDTMHFEYRPELFDTID